MKATFVADSVYHYFTLTSESPAHASVLKVTAAGSYVPQNLLVTARPGSGGYRVIVYNGNWDPADLNIPGVDDPYCLGMFYDEEEGLVRGSARDTSRGFWSIVTPYVSVEDVLSIAIVPTAKKIVSVGVRVQLVSL